MHKYLLIILLICCGSRAAEEAFLEKEPQTFEDIKNIQQIETFNKFTFNDYMNCTETTWNRKTFYDDKNKPKIIVYWPISQQKINRHSLLGRSIKLNEERSSTEINAGKHNKEISDALESARTKLQTMLEDKEKLIIYLKDIPAQGNTKCDTEKTIKLLECMLNKIDKLRITLDEVDEDTKRKYNIEKVGIIVIYGVAPRQPANDIVIFTTTINYPKLLCNTILHEISHICGTNDYGTRHEIQFTGIPFAHKIAEIITNFK